MKKVLLVEDDVILRENTAELLELSNYNVVTASDGKKGVLLAEKELPDIIVCDIMMPELDGYGVLEALSKNDRTKRIPFIFLSAKTERNEVRRGMNLGADDYITKPFEEEELINAIESRLAKVRILSDMNQVEASNGDREDEIANINQLKNYFLDEGEMFTYEEGALIYSEGNHSNYMFLIEEGMVKSFKIDEQGKELITKVSKEDDFFGYSSFTQNIPYKEYAKAIKNTTVYAVKKDILSTILNDNKKLSIEIVDFLAEGLTEFNNQLLQMAYGSVRRKTAATILQFVDQFDRNKSEGIKISRNDLASVAGIAPESFIRTLSELKKEGLIAVEGRNIKVLDIERLRNVD
ncbi:cAMP-binding domain of CRP or a regulatory subunit of cAMP-dependent protein kinases [Zhouia amylolytica]|uniref:Transcriptional regulator n=2 Tax=Zhouia amylolytica TaxID=376730 RepID=W2ULR1_9FLAO|nr:response regulator [Zhouia amylolytica]ETN94914.1 transcriptional regulator [Zhouia amylolytica AD3]MCQ0110511.1 response regulator [Zhouia amylolytica]SFS66054.1 cAMP-binding domain of CRP or a regulatory subunit of cAMP-dependent protein kinases [Zhouia amylolytica]